MSDNFYSSNIIGRMKSPKESAPINGSPTTPNIKRGNSFYESASYKSGGSVKTTGGIPGGKGEMTSPTQNKGTDPGNKGTTNVKKGHSQVSPKGA